MPDRLGITLLISLITFAASAQHDSIPSKVGWFVSFHVGVLIPEPGSTASMSAQMMQGVRYDRLRLGVGVGYDSYENWDMLPVFAGFACDVMRHGRNALYVQVNGGFAKAWSRIPNESGWWVKEDDGGGYFFHPMVGYRFSQGKMALHLTGGYKIQKIHYRQSSRGWGWPITTSVVQDIERLTVQIGIGLH